MYCIYIYTHVDDVGSSLGGLDEPPTNAIAAWLALAGTKRPDEGRNAEIKSARQASALGQDGVCHFGDLWLAYLSNT